MGRSSGKGNGDVPYYCSGCSQAKAGFPWIKTRVMAERRLNERRR
jgi:hypothetical protein